MIKQFFLSGAVILGIFQLTISCNSNANNTPVTDSIHSSDVIDSMPVMNTPVMDSSSIIITPPVGDENVIIPDANKGSRN
jgi:hypothetical protein